MKLKINNLVTITIRHISGNKFDNIKRGQALFPMPHNIAQWSDRNKGPILALENQLEGIRVVSVTKCPST